MSNRDKLLVFVRNEYANLESCVSRLTYVSLEGKCEPGQSQFHSQDNCHNDSKGEQNAVRLHQRSATSEESNQEYEESNNDYTDGHCVGRFHESFEVLAFLDHHESEVDQKTPEDLNKNSS